MAKIERSIDIAARAEDVFDALADWARLTTWSTVTVEHTGPERCTEVGEEFDQTIRVAGVPMSTQWRVTQYDAPRSLTYEVTAAGGARMTMTQRVLASDGGSRVELNVDYDLPGGVLGDVVDRLYVERRNEREAEHSLQNLKDLVEGRAQG